MDYQVWKDQAPADTKLLFQSVERVVSALEHKVGAVVTDRGFASAANSQDLKDCDIFDATCPRNPEEVKARMKEKRFSDLQRRRAQTEGRISILKQQFFGRPMRAKGFANRELAVAWSVLTHNLWKLARMRKKKKKEALLQVA